FDDGTKIPSAIRALYRDDSDIRLMAGANPFASGEVFTVGQSEGLPIILRSIWLQHQHLQQSFPDPLGSSREAFYHWFINSGAKDIGIADAFVSSVKRSLDTLHAVKTAGPMRHHAANSAVNGTSLWARGLIYLHKRVTGGSLSTARMMQYRQITGPVQFLRLLFRQFRGSRWAARFGLALPTPANANPMQTAMNGNVPSFVPRWRSERYAGLYAEPGKEVWWVGVQARFRVGRMEGLPIVRLRGIHMGDLHHSAHGQYEMTIGVGFDGCPQQLVKAPAGPFDISIELDALPQSWPAILHVVPQSSFVASEIGMSDDTRRLSLQLASVDFGDIRLFNTTSFNPPLRRNTSMRLAFSGAAAKGVPGVNVIGYARSEHGVGQSLRQCATALDAARVPSAIIDFNHNNQSRIQDTSLESRIVTEPEYGVNVFHINADQMPEAVRLMPEHVFDRYNIAMWHWELPEMLDSHLAGFERLNEVWAPSAFVQDAVARRSPIPVIRMPHAIHFTVSPDANRVQFDLPDDRFVFLMMYDFSSYQERKNPQAALAAYERAYAYDNTKAVLVIKTQNAQFHEKEVKALRDRIAGREDVIWINETLSRQQVYDLLSVCDSLVSLHRSEGFGLGPAEAMFLGKPVIATNWSGNTEFMRADNSLPVNYKLVKLAKNVGVYPAGQVWAEPDVAHAARLMRQIVDDDVLRANVSKEAKRTMQEEFSPEVIGRRISARLTYIKNSLMNH
ncbi:MAG TPA: glycosyltransferase family 4 protein, partial [Burkholderiaceae bacterium]|nr:glycosyltransferase family 4 protein [Burkholderiaceae bacterium]